MNVMPDSNAKMLYNDEAEKCFLGALLLNWNVMGQVISELQPEQLFRHHNRIIYQTMTSMYGKVDNMDVLVLINELNKQNLLDRAGGYAYLSSLTDTVPSAANIDYYIKNIKECYSNRELKDISFSLNDNVNQGLTPEENIEQIRKRLEQVQVKSSEAQIITAAQMMKESTERILNNIGTQGQPRGVTTGFPSLDGILGGGLKPRHLIILAARPSIGKTALALNLLENAAGKGYKAGFISLEMTSEELSNRLISQCSGVPGDKLNSGFMSQNQMKEISSATDYISKLPIYLIEKHGIGINEICGIMRNLVLKYGLQIIFIDYLGLIRSSGNGMQQWQEFGLFCESVRSTAIQMNVPVVLLCQLNRNAEDEEPTLGDLKGSGEIEQHADEIFLIHGSREFDPQKPVAERTLIVGKQRNGITRKLKMNYVCALTKFQEAE